MDHPVIKAGFREFWFIGKEVEDELDRTPLLVASRRFGNKHFIALEIAGAGKREGQRNQTHSHGRLLGRRPTELSFDPPAGTAEANRSQQKRGCNPVPCPDPNHSLSLELATYARSLTRNQESFQLSATSDASYIDCRNGQAVARQVLWKWAQRTACNENGAKSTNKETRRYVCAIS